MSPNLQDVSVPMKVVYRLWDELQQDTEQVSLTQALTLDSSKPDWGLKGTFGLFGSQQWWQNIKQRKAPLIRVNGVISGLHVEGQDEEGIAMELTLADGSIHYESLYATAPDDMGLFKVGCRVDILYVLEELKQQPAFDGGINYSQIPLEVAVSLRPVK